MCSEHIVRAPSLIPHSCSLSLLYAVHLSKTCSTLSSSRLLHITHCLPSSLFFHPPTSALSPADLVLNQNLSLAPLLSPGSFTYFSSFNCFFTAAYRSRVFLLCTSSNHLCLHFLFRLLPHFSIRRCSYHIFFFAAHLCAITIPRSNK